MESFLIPLDPEDYSRQEWDLRRPEIERLYIQEDLKLPELIEKMNSVGFHATPKQYKDRLAKWKLRKNIKRDQALWMVQKQQKRKFHEGKDTIFKINGRPVKKAKIERHKIRMEGTTFISDYVAATPPGVSYSTPRNGAMSPDPARVCLPESPRCCSLTTKSPIAPDVSQIWPAVSAYAESPSSQSLHENHESPGGSNMLPYYDESFFESNIEDLLGISLNHDQNFSNSLAICPEIVFNLPGRNPSAQSPSLPFQRGRIGSPTRWTESSPAKSDGFFSALYSMPDISLDQHQQVSDIDLVDFHDSTPGWLASAPNPAISGKFDSCFGPSIVPDKTLVPQSHNEGYITTISTQDDSSYHSSFNFNDATSNLGESATITSILAKAVMPLMMMHPLIYMLISKTESLWKVTLPQAEKNWLWSEFRMLLASSHEASAAALRQQIATKCEEGTSCGVSSSTYFGDLQQVEGPSKRLHTHWPMPSPSSKIRTYRRTGEGYLAFELDGWPFSDTNSSSVTISFVPPQLAPRTGVSIKFVKFLQEHLTPQIYRHLTIFNIIPWKSPLRNAIQNNDILEVRNLFASRKASPYDRLENGHSILCIARGSSLEMIQLLLQEGANPRDAYGGKYHMIWSIWLHFVSLVSRRENLTEDLSTYIDHYKKATDLVLKSGAHIEECENFMEYGNLLFFSGSIHFGQPLDLATQTSLNDYFLAIGSDIEKRNSSQGNTPLLAAAANYHLYAASFLRYLLDRGSEVNATNGRNQNALHLALESYKSLLARRKRKISEEGYTHRSIGLSVDEEQELDDTDERIRFMHQHQELQQRIHILLQAGCDPSLRDYLGRSPADVAAEFGFWEERNEILDYQLAAEI